MEDYYEILQVSVKAEPEVVVAAYKALVSKYHPDKHPNRSLAEQRTMALNEAYGVLKDASRRAEYDARKTSGRTPSGRVVPAPPHYGGKWGRARLRDDRGRDHDATVEAIDPFRAQVRSDATLKGEAVLVLSLGPGESPLLAKVRIAGHREEVYDLRFGALTEREKQALLAYISRRS